MATLTWEFSAQDLGNRGIWIKESGDWNMADEREVRVEIVKPLKVLRSYTNWPDASLCCSGDQLTRHSVHFPKTRPGPLALNAARPGLKCGPAAHTVLRSRYATSHATSKRRHPVLLWHESDHCPHASLTVAYTPHLSPSSSLSVLAMNSVMALILCYVSPNSTGTNARYLGGSWASCSFQSAVMLCILYR